LKNTQAPQRRNGFAIARDQCEALCRKRSRTRLHASVSNALNQRADLTECGGFADAPCGEKIKLAVMKKSSASPGFSGPAPFMVIKSLAARIYFCAERAPTRHRRCTRFRGKLKNLSSQIA
jgi:hypothetical protein